MTGAADRETVRQRVVYKGRVQGVCFRAVSVELSRQGVVVGYVRNLPDGTVELEAEGPADEVEAFLTRVQTYFDRSISNTQRTTLPARGDESRFEIRF